MLRFTRFRSATAALAVLLGALSAAAAEAPSRQTVVASKDYMVGGFTRLWLGADYRKLWATPVSVEVLDLGREAGGLKPVRRVGGQQTKGLALAGADGRSYTFRGLDKDASHLLDTVDPELKNTVVAKVLDLLMAAQHPASDLIARGILDAVGIPCPDWRLVVLPDDPALGEFQKDFAGAIGMFAAYPEPARGGAPGFIGATEIVDHAELYKRLQAGNGDAIDTQALLKARLVDIFMGDWDRHRKQWRWAKLPGHPLWVPIPEDRDQAFSRYEGLALDMARGTDPRFQNFGPKYAGIGGLTFNGSEQDRQLLVPFSREDFVRGGEGPPGAADERSDRQGGARDAARVVRGRRRTARLRPQVAARPAGRRGREVPRAPRRPGGRAPHEQGRADRGEPSPERRHRGHGPRPGRGRPAGAADVPPGLRREGDGRDPLLHLRRQRHA